MQIISLGRGKGKTEYLLREFVKNPNAVLVTFSERERQRILAQYFVTESAKAKAEKRIISCRDVMSKLSGRPTNMVDLYVDNVDLVLQVLFTQPVKVATITDAKEE